jgi:hypothetical protein
MATLTIQQIVEKAIAEGWSNKQTKKAATKAGLDGEAQAAVIAGLRAAGRAKGPTGEDLRREAEEKAKAEAQAAAQVAENNRKLQEAHEREVREAQAAKLSEEREAMASVEPHWPTYRRAMSLAKDWHEACDARQHRDSGDWIAFKQAGDDLLLLAEEVMLPQDSTAGSILIKTVAAGWAMSEAQAKLVAIAIAKLATANGMTGEKPVAPETSHLQERLTAENPEIVITINRQSPQKAVFRFSASKKTGTKPYAAILGPNFSREFIDGKKFTNTSKSFWAEGLAVGTVIEFRGFNWSAKEGAFVGGVDYVLIVEGGAIQISRTAAREVVEGAETILLDRHCEVIRFVDDFLPENPECGISGLVVGLDGEEK